MAIEGKFAWAPALLIYLRITHTWSLNQAVRAWNAIYHEDDSLTRTQLLRYERGENLPRADRVGMLADLYGVEPTYFFVRSKDELYLKLGDFKDRVLAESKRVEELAAAARLKETERRGR